MLLKTQKISSPERVICFWDFAESAGICLISRETAAVAPKTKAAPAVNAKPNRADPGGRCRHSTMCDCSGWNGIVSELPMIFVQLGKSLCNSGKDWRQYSKPNEHVVNALKNLTSSEPLVRPSGDQKFGPSKSAWTSRFSGSSHWLPFLASCTKAIDSGWSGTPHLHTYLLSQGND